MPIHKEYDKNFFKLWSRDMAYVLGFLFADGNIIKTKRGTHFTSIYTKDRRLIYSMRSSMNSNHKIAKRISETGHCYNIQIGSKELFADLLALGLIVKKANRMKLPHLPKKYVNDFVRGYFDGDGNVWVGNTHKHRKTKTLTMLSCFTSASTSFLKDLLSLLKTVGVSGGSAYQSGNGKYGRLTLSTTDSLKLYEIMYNKPHKLFLPRKKLVFDKFIEKRKNALVV